MAIPPMAVMTPAADSAQSGVSAIRPRRRQGPPQAHRPWRQPQACRRAVRFPRPLRLALLPSTPIRRLAVTLYDMAWADYTAGSGRSGIEGFDGLRALASRKSEFADDAQYYIGESYFQRGKFAEAVDAYYRVWCPRIPRATSSGRPTTSAASATSA